MCANSEDSGETARMHGSTKSYCKTGTTVVKPGGSLVTEGLIALLPGGTVVTLE